MRCCTSKYNFRNKDRMAYDCEKVRKDIDFYFATPRTEENVKAERALWKAIGHMTKGTTKEKHNISCSGCWEYYQEMKRIHCGG